MSSATLFRLSGWVAIVCGLCLLLDTLVIELFLPEAVLTNTVGHIGIVSGLFALLGVYLRQRPASGVLGDVGFCVNYLGLGLLIGVMFFTNYVRPFLSQEALSTLFAGPARAVFLTSALIFLTGVVLFGSATLRAGVFPRLAAVLYIVGFVLFSLEPFLPDLVVRTAQVCASLGVIWFGYTLRRAEAAVGVLRVAS